VRPVTLVKLLKAASVKRLVAAPSPPMVMRLKVSWLAA